MEWKRRSILVLLAAVVLVPGLAVAEEPAPLPLHERIDRMIESHLEGVAPAAPATDAEFLRRAWLDFAGMIPTSAEARAFLDDPSAYKRSALVETLLDSPRYARRMQEVFDTMLMERRPEMNVPAAPWQAFLRDAFARNVPYDQLVREILSADGSDPTARGPARFYLDRQGEPNLLTRDVGRFFLGRDMQCAQCHDHPIVDDFKQAHYHGLYAFFNRSFPVAEASGVTTLAEKADGDVSFASVFKKKIVKTTRPRIIDGPEVDEPKPAKGQEYRVAPLDKIRSIPTYSRRARLPEILTSAEVPAFSRNAVNRLWALVIGRGIFHPLDMDHGDNPPSHPELLDMLAKEFVAMKYDIKKFIRELTATRVYQRSSERPPGASPGSLAPETFAVGMLKPLAPEQIAWSLMQATGVLEGTRKAVEQQWLGVDPKFRDLVKTDPKRKALGVEMIERTILERLGGQTAPFVSRFGGAPGQAQDAGQSSVDQALFVSNGEPIQSWLAPSGDNLTGRLTAMTDPSAVAEELYLTILTRRPTADERKEVADYLASRGKERAQGLREIAWALIASAEFRFNH